MKQPSPKQTVIGSCRDISYEGFGVVRYDKSIVFVEGMFPGEEGEVELSYRRNGQWFGELRKLFKVSPHRVQPRCKICHACGGCQFQQLDYESQLLWKSQKVKEQFKKRGGMDVDVLPCLGMEEPYNYRNKIQMPFGKDRRGNIYCGFYKPGTHVIVPVETCHIEDPRADRILQKIKTLMKSFRVEPYAEDERYGVLRHVLIRTSYYKKEIMVVLVTNVDSFPSRNNFVKELVKQCPEITTVVQNINSRSTNVILGDRERILYGKGYIEDSLCGVSFHISAKSFYQTNPVMTEILYQEAIKRAQITDEDIVFDAYSGIGTIGLIAAKNAAKVISVEIVPSAVADGRRNAKENGIENFCMYCDDASSFMVKMAERRENVDVLFMDPPRKGSDQRFLDALLRLKPSRVVYVSCDPSTLARDVAYISKSYQIESVQPVDMFPQTTHVETVAMLRLKDSKK